MLFKPGLFTGTSGGKLIGKIECDALDDEDWQWVANLILHDNVIYGFGGVEGVPTGGLKLEKILKPYAAQSEMKYQLPLIIVDDVWTTGASMERQRAGRDAIGYVLFARSKPAPWVKAIFQGCDALGVIK